jgi:energy-coupling factor transporter ATP-binding protein EcfA2
MYLQKFTVQGIKCFDRVELEFPGVGDDYSGWIVLLGGNGMGKSTLLQAMAIALVGPLAGQRLLLSPDGWVRQGQKHGEFSASVVKGEMDLAVWKARKKYYETRFAVTGQQEVVLDNTTYDQPQLVPLLDDKKALMSGPYAARNLGWFSCGYGPFRRLLGGASEEARLLFTLGRESRFVTLFREAAALPDCIEWLSTLYSRSIDPRHPAKPRAASTLDTVRRVIDGLLPGGVRIKSIDSQRVTFHGFGSAEMPALELSDGYRSFLALAIDILRRLDNDPPGFSHTLAVTDTPSMYALQHDLGRWVDDEGGEPRITVEGVILIDEVDAHLHPVWQREIGFRLRRTFPNMQFIVTSHSPFVAQAASDGGLIVLRAAEAGGGVEAQRPVDSVKGWRADQILTSPLFGLTGTRDEETEDIIRQHADLVAKRSSGQLTPAEKKQLARLEERLADRLTAPGETAEERSIQQDMARYVEQTLAKFEGAR